MLLLFVVIFILSSQLIHAVAVDQRSGFNPFPFGTSILCILQHPLLLVMSIFYLGWVWGPVLFLCHLFGILHMTVSWVLDIPTLLAKDYRQLQRLIKTKIALLTPMLIIVLGFTVTSFFVADFKSLFAFLANNTSVLIGAICIAAALSIARLIVVKRVSDSQ